ncbi:PLC-like phosphodiesterase [Coprinopsis sp. MPI-PUGE-AT-0042]|nr:PLC-like phosphodiesterase [Coprinopsis sp. MPI-PUGE-AT-0042]
MKASLVSGVLLGLMGAVHGSSVGSYAGGLSGISRRATVCNGHAELCERGYGSLAYVGTHNSYAVGVNILAANQDQDITRQLNDGVRMLQMQAHDEEGVIKLCHTVCLLYDGGSLEAYLRTVKAWLDANPNEVISLLIVNSDNVAATRFADIFATTGIDTVSYRPATSPLAASEWPTLGEMIDSNQRVVTFLSTSANMAEVPYLIDEFPNVWETAFNLLDPALFDCSVNRTRGDTSTQLFLINHFLDKLFLGNAVPDIDKLPQTNAASGFGSLGAHVETCVGAHGRAPNFLLVDFYEYGGGSVFQVAASINGVPYEPATPVATPVPTQAGTQTQGRSATDAGSARALQPWLGAGQIGAAVLAVASVVAGRMLVL